MGAPDSVVLPIIVLPNQTVDVSVHLVAPSNAGQYEGFWQLQSSDGRNFGVGASANTHIWIKISTAAPASNGPTSTTVQPPVNPTSTSGPSREPPSTLNVAYDFAGNACAAMWQSNDGNLPCPGVDGDMKGFVINTSQANLEDGTAAKLPTILTFPQSSAAGHILGIYPAYQVQEGDHFQTTVSCEIGATACSVLFSLTYLDSAGSSHDLWTLGEFYDGKYFNLDLDLSNLAGQKVRFVLSVSNLGSSNGDRALWVAPRIVSYAAANPTLAGTSTVTLTVPFATPTLAPPATPSSTRTMTATFVPTVVSTTALPTPMAGTWSIPPPAQQIFESIVSFFRQLLAGK